MPENVMQDLVRDWLQSKHETLFGKFFDLSQNVDAAADWFLTEVEEFLQHAEQAQPRSYTGGTAAFDVVG